MALSATEKTRDNYHAYYSEKIWEMIPSYYRHEDGIGMMPDTLRSMVELVAREVARVRRSHDRLWQDQSIEHCQDWAVPYIGDLLATRLLSALNRRGQRIDVAKTIYYRRRKGTLGLLEELISDIAGWDGKVVESFKQLGRTRHALDPALPMHGQDINKLLGAHTRTPQGGMADLRNVEGGELVGSGFDEFFYTPDFRQHNGSQGRYNIPKLGFHLFRKKSFPVTGSNVFQLDNGRFSFDPSGRETVLFSRRNRAKEWHNWHSAEFWELPAPISCRSLNHSIFVISNRLLIDLQSQFNISELAITALASLVGQVHSSWPKLLNQISFLNQAELQTAAVEQFIRKSALIELCGKYQLLPGSLAVYEDGNRVERDKIAGADLSSWPVTDAGLELLIDPQRGIMQFFGTAPQNIRVDYHYGLPMGLGAGSHDRSYIENSEPTSWLSEGAAVGSADVHNKGTLQISDNLTHSFQANKNKVEDLGIQAANGCRPYLRLTADWLLRGLHPKPVGREDVKILLDGLWFGAEGAPRSIIIQGAADFESVEISHCTLDPGGSRNIAGDIIEPVHLVIEAKIETLHIKNSIIGTIEIRDEGLVETIKVSDSVVDVITHATLTGASNPHTRLVMDASPATIYLYRSTVSGTIRANRLWAADSLLTNPPQITDIQTGCFRFSGAPKGSKLPRPYESHVIEDSSSLFISNELGHPDYFQLSEQAPLEIREGAENGAEMGAFNLLLNSIKQESLEKKVYEYMPFGLIPLFIKET